jgi:hypothetical protein
MQQVQQQSTLPLTRTVLAPVVALVIGAAAATGVYVLADDAGVKSGSGLVAKSNPGNSGETKDEAHIAAAIGNPGVSGETKDEAAIAAAIGSPGVSGETKDEAHIAAAIGNPGVSGETKDEAAIAPSRQRYLSQEAERGRRTVPR